MKLSNVYYPKQLLLLRYVQLWPLQPLLHHKVHLIPLKFKITGEASRSVAPNYAILTLGITSENTNINAAKSNNDRIMSDLISKLGHLGIDKKRYLHI